MKRIALLVAAVMVAMLMTSPAHAGSKGTIVVIGDSTSSPSDYKSRGNKASTIWWSRISRAAHLSARIHAEPGSGYSRPGKCTGTTIGQRINDPVVRRQLTKASIVVVAAGVNDNRMCQLRDDGTFIYVPTLDDVLEADIAQAMADLDAAVPNNRRVYITVPYGPRPTYKPFRKRITSRLARYAAEHGFTYVRADGGVLGGSRTSDRLHPNSHGGKALYRHLYLNTSMVKFYPRD